MVSVSAIAVLSVGACLWLYAQSLYWRLQFLRERRRHVRTEEALREVRHSLRETQELARIGAWEYNIRTDRIRWSEETFHIFGLPSGQQEPDFADVLRGVHPADLPVFDRAVQRAVTAQEAYRLDLRILTAEGKLKYIHARGTPIVGRNGEVERIIGTVLDITERKEVEQQLARLASHDPLTGLPNRRQVIEQLQREVAIARRHESPLTVCICDLDQFKSINDTFGHLSGDQLLIDFARMLSEGTRSGDMVARLGGDEFCFVLPRTSPSQARVCTERIRTNLERTLFTAPDGREFRATASFGMADLEPGVDYVGLLQAADEALYQAKRSGRNRSVLLERDVALSRVRMGDVWDRPA
jgi:diguanylate cyclase (GGDEF)-like protein/PAS domain S-box-containing protein